METKVNVVISPSQQDTNPTAINDNKANTEAKLTRLIGEEVIKLLETDLRINAVLIPDYSLGSDAQNLKAAINFSNKFITQNGGKGYHLEIHSDGGYSGHGATGFYVSEAGKAFGRPIFQKMAALTPWDDMTFRQRNNLAALNQTKAVAYLQEVSFHDKKDEAYWIFNNIKNIAKTIVDGIYIGINLEQYIIPAWQFNAFRKLVTDGFIDSPGYWKDKLHLPATVGDLMGIINKLRGEST